MDIKKYIVTIADYIKGFVEIANIQTERYRFIIQSLDLAYQGEAIKTQVRYIPIGCYRIFKNFISELNDETVCRKFKPDHARIIISIDTLEKTLDFKNEKQVQIYLNHIKSCALQLKRHS